MTTKVQKKFTSEIIIPENQEKIILAETIPESNIILQKNAKLTFCSVLQKGWKKKKTLNFEFKGKNAELKFITIILGQAQNSFDFETNAIHHLPQTKSDFRIRSVLNDQSQVNYRGCLIIKPKAQETDAKLAHHTLTLSDQAKTETTPCLEIEADNVKASHSATMGKIDEEILFYLQSRGLETNYAKTLLTEGFLKTDLRLITDLKIQNKLQLLIKNQSSERR